MFFIKAVYIRQRLCQYNAIAVSANSSPAQLKIANMISVFVTGIFFAQANPCIIRKMLVNNFLLEVLYKKRTDMNEKAMKNT
jgi:hypothetical protein